MFRSLLCFRVTRLLPSCCALRVSCSLRPSGLNNICDSPSLGRLDAAAAGIEDIRVDLTGSAGYRGFQEYLLYDGRGVWRLYDQAKSWKNTTPRNRIVQLVSAIGSTSRCSSSVAAIGGLGVKSGLDWRKAWG